MNSEQVSVDPSTVFLDLQTLEFQTNHSSSNSDVSDQETIIYDEFMDNNDSENGDSSDNDNSGDDFYEIDTDSDNEELPSYPITNMPITIFVNDLPELLHYHQDDELSDWNYEQIDSGPSWSPFRGNSRTNIEDLHGKPEVFFNGLFDDRMWTVLADSTNMYARSKCNTNGGNRCLDPTHPDYKKHCRLNSWSDASVGDIKMFMAHILIMGLVKKPDVEKYWNTKTKAKVPFFGQYMSRNRFQALLWNFHVNDDSDNPPPNTPGHDPLSKLRPFVDMVERNFIYAYQPAKALSFDEACCPFKGRLKFRVYNKSKPNRFHIKLFQVSEASSGYILGFHIYTGKNSSCVSSLSKPLDPKCCKTTKIVLGLLEATQLLDKGHHIYMDNYYTSPELFSELYCRETYACGTVKLNRIGMPMSVKNAQLKPLESVYLRNGPLLCLKWSGEKKKSKKKPVTILSTIHQATELLTKKKDRHGNRIPKPVPVYEYTKYMSGVDLSDQYMSFHVALRKSMKWSRKLFFHLFNMVILNSYLLNKKFGKRKLSKHDYIEYIANYLVDTGSPTLTCVPRRTFNPSNLERLTERHFPKRIPLRNGKLQGIVCRACNFTKSQITTMGFASGNLSRKTTIYWCEECETPLCITPCFEIYHTVSDYRRVSLLRRLPNE